MPMPMSILHNVHLMQCWCECEASPSFSVSGTWHTATVIHNSCLAPTYVCLGIVVREGSRLGPLLGSSHHAHFYLEFEGSRQGGSLILILSWSSMFIPMHILHKFSCLTVVWWRFLVVTGRLKWKTLAWVAAYIFCNCLKLLFVYFVCSILCIGSELSLSLSLSGIVIQYCLGLGVRTHCTLDRVVLLLFLVFVVVVVMGQWLAGQVQWCDFVFCMFFHWSILLILGRCDCIYCLVYF